MPLETREKHLSLGRFATSDELSIFWTFRAEYSQNEAPNWVFSCLFIGTQFVFSLSMKTLILILAFVSFNSFAARIPDNHCLGNVDSKVYKNADFHQAYPRKVSFECTYECKANGKVTKVKGLRTVTVNNMEDDASGTVCQGVILKKVPWGWDFDKVVPFYAFDTSMNDVKRFAFENMNFKNQTEQEYLLRLKDTLKVVAKAFAQAGHPEFYQASQTLTKISDELPAKTTTLDKYIKLVIEARGHVPFEAKADSLVLTNVKTHAAWRVPHYQY